MKMHSRKISLNNFIIPRNKNISNEQILFKDKLQLQPKLTKIHINNNNIDNRKQFMKKKEIQENSINEEDDYFFEVYNNSIEKDDDFLIGYNNDNKFKTITANNNFNGINKKFLKFNNIKKMNINNYKKYCTNSLEYNNYLNLNTIEGNEKKYTDENTNNLINNINMFKMVHKERKKNKLLNSILSKDKNQTNLFELNNNNKYIITNKYSKKNKINKIQSDNGKNSNHIKVCSQPFNGPYLRKNKINNNKNINKNNGDKNFEYILDLNDDENFSKNMTKIEGVTTSLFNRYSEIDTNIYDQEIDSTNEHVKEIQINKNQNIKNITNCICDSKKDESVDNNNNYIFNLKLYNIYNNNKKQNKNYKIKSKSNSMINQYYSFDENNMNKNMKKEKVEKPRPNIFKKKVILEEEYIIDPNGNQKFLCVKRVANNNNINEDNINNKEYNNNKRAFTSNNLFLTSSNKITKQNMDNYNSKNNNKNYNNVNYNKKNNNRNNLEAKTVFCSPQISYENIFSPNINTTKSFGKIKDFKNLEKQYLLYNINNINKIKEINNLPNSKSYIFKCDDNIKFHKIDDYNNKNNNFNPKNRMPSYNYKKNKEKNEIEINNLMNYEKPMMAKKKINKKYEGQGQSAITLNNSRNYNINNYININEYNNNKEKYNENISNDKINNKKLLYKTANSEIKNIYIPKQIFSNRSENNNYKLHEIKSTSKDKSYDNELNFENNHNNNFYFEYKKKYPKIFPSTSMDNIKMKKNSVKLDNFNENYVKDRLDGNYNYIPNLKLVNLNNPLYYSQEIQ